MSKIQAFLPTQDQNDPPNASTPSSTPQKSIPAPPKKTGCISHPQKMAFDAIPKYMRGRLTLDKFCVMIDDLNEVVQSKKALMEMPTSGMNEKMMKHYAYNVDTLPTSVLDITHFTEMDLKSCPSIQWPSATSKAAIHVLRHLKQIKEEHTAQGVKYWRVY